MAPSDSTLASEYKALHAAALELLAAIDKRWEHETSRKRENAISPRMEEAIDELRRLLFPMEEVR